MPELPVISGKDAAKAFEKIGFRFHHQKGSHMSITDQVAVIFPFPTIKNLIAALCVASLEAPELP